RINQIPLSYVAPPRRYQIGARQSSMEWVCWAKLQVGCQTNSKGALSQKSLETTFKWRPPKSWGRFEALPIPGGRSPSEPGAHRRPDRRAPRRSRQFFNLLWPSHAVAAQIVNRHAERLHGLLRFSNEQHAAGRRRKRGARPCGAASEAAPCSTDDEPADVQ